MEVDELCCVGEQEVSSLANADSACLVISNDAEMSVRREGGEESPDEFPVSLKFLGSVREDVKRCLDKKVVRGRPGCLGFDNLSRSAGTSDDDLDGAESFALTIISCGRVDGGVDVVEVDRFPSEQVGPLCVWELWKSW